MYNNNSLLNQITLKKANIGDWSTMTSTTPVYSDVVVDFREPFMFLLDCSDLYSTLTNENIKITGQFQYSKLRDTSSLPAEKWQDMLTFSNEKPQNITYLSKSVLDITGKDNFQFTMAHTHNPQGMTADKVIFVRVKFELINGNSLTKTPNAYLIENSAMGKFMNNNKVNY